MTFRKLPHTFSAADQDAVYRAIFARRDMRHFVPGALPEGTLNRLLHAAHAAPSVGFMQPWRFIRITDSSVRTQLKAVVEEERIATAKALDTREDEFMRLKVEGLNDCAEVLVVCLTNHREDYIFGRRTLPQMDLASASCAIQNMWLAARAEGIGMGWVSIFQPARLSALLNLPEGAEAIAILCIGQVTDFYDKPMLETEGWDTRKPLETMLMENHWQETPNEHKQQTINDPSSQSDNDDPSTS
ncbi:5,6-dimethylbenzimidazole synthase [BD1-7 clade bacterium]|uniref:5,6-dimethylbenzimidazole synthase n=1 Tax=BD1-7 clade bacterium TaxID=2029982 RepID=A0A5S9P9J8_9GAMM|nr:5,6-dimethylbenzimidazole synthase [BD1-7 clade bacterium]CAA0115773.1 5,6-dimethylbenzimidazole synthase [BD1-7 clade bacterium]